jgi:hypothetical protein
MRTITAIVLSLMLYGCSVTPKVIPDETKGSAMTRKIDKDTEMGKPLQTGYGWILWYIPVVVVAMAWGYREFFRKPTPEDDSTPKKTKRRK